jgi:uncharacterized protein YecE (DUF72 family)
LRITAVLFQFPPDLHYQPQTPERVLDVLDPGWKNVFEFRHPSWWCATASTALAEWGVAFCSVSAPGLPETYLETAPFAYVRFHGRERWYASTYSQGELSGWAKQLQQGTGQEVFAYFNNDVEACAPQHALALQQLLEVA